MLHIEKSSKMTKNWQKNEDKPCSTCVQPISRIDFWSQKPDFIQDPVHYIKSCNMKIISRYLPTYTYFYVLISTYYRRLKRNLTKSKKTCSSGRRKTNPQQVNWKQVKLKNLRLVVVAIIRASCIPLCPEYFYKHLQ